MLAWSNAMEMCMIVMHIDKNIPVHNAFSDISMYLCEMCFQNQKEKKEHNIAFVSTSDFCV